MINILLEGYEGCNINFNLFNTFIKSHLQHLWATAVETMGLARRESIKTGQGNDDIKRFFILISSLFALRENMPVVPGLSLIHI